MTSIYQLKPAFQSLLRPLVNCLAEAGMTANAVTLFAMALSIAFGVCLLVWPESRGLLMLLPLVLLLRMALNAVDGMLAREHGQSSSLGAILNELGDAVSDAALYLPLALFAAFNPSLIVVIVALALISEVTGLAALHIGAERRYDGPMGKSDRAFVFGALALWVAFGGPTEPWVEWILMLMVLLLGLTVWRRAQAALKQAA